MPLKIFGKSPKDEHFTKISSSKNFKDGVFQNSSKTDVMSEKGSTLKTLKAYYNKPKTTRPPKELPSVKTNLHSINESNPVIIWFGHSSYFIKIENKTILVDPVFSGNASPFTFAVNAFKGADVYTPEDFPAIDILILTHDHYDHLDYKTLVKLKSKVGHIYTSLGVGAHLKHWGISSDIITELDWWDSATHEDFTITAAPSRHFSGRLFKRGQSLWSSFIVKTKNHNLYLGGDSGYDSHFKTIGEKYGPFDIAILESGQYNESWKQIHMMPEETVQASIDLKAKVLLPVHWGKFELSLHPWDEPIQRVLKEAAKLNVTVTHPLIGEAIILNQSYPTKQWWNF